MPARRSGRDARLDQAAKRRIFGTPALLSELSIAKCAGRIRTPTLADLIDVTGYGDGGNDCDDGEYDHQLDQRKTLHCLTAHRRVSPQNPVAIVAPVIAAIGRIGVVHPAHATAHPLGLAVLSPAP